MLCCAVLRCTGGGRGVLVVLGLGIQAAAPARRHLLCTHVPLPKKHTHTHGTHTHGTHTHGTHTHTHTRHTHTHTHTAHAHARTHRSKLLFVTSEGQRLYSMLSKLKHDSSKALEAAEAKRQ